MTDFANKREEEVVMLFACACIFFFNKTKFLFIYQSFLFYYLFACCHICLILLLVRYTSDIHPISISITGILEISKQQIVLVREAKLCGHIFSNSRYFCEMVTIFLADASLLQTRKMCSHFVSNSTCLGQVNVGVLNWSVFLLDH